MKPKKLRLKNFGPFIEETIDFSKLTEVPLFLITGKTGAGKTTLFDGMTYALFGETSGRVRSGKEMRSLFATPEEETSVFFTFEHQGMSYKIERKPEQLLAKRKGAGNRKQTAKVSLTIFDEAGKEVRQFTKRNEVDQLVKEMMNLDAKQFSQIVLLPQGEFRQFLISSSNEKEIVLRNLFGTQFFQLLNEQLKEKAKQHQKTLDHFEQELTLLQKRFVPNKDGIMPENLNFDAVLSYWQKEQEIIHERLLQERAILSNLQEKQKQLEDTCYHLEVLQTRQEEKVHLTQKKKELLLQENKINDKKQWNRHYEFAEKLVDALLRRQEYQSEQEELDKKEKDCSTKLIQKKQVYTAWETRAPQRLNVQNEIQNSASALQEMRCLLPIAEECQKKQLENKNLLLEKEKFEEKKQKIIQKQAQIQEEQRKLHERLEDQEKLHEDQICYEKLCQEQEKYQISVEQWQHIKGQLKENQEYLVEITKQHQMNQIALSKQSNLVDALKSQWASQQIARLQLILQPDEPCPVCGSVEHPKQQNTHKLPEQTEIIKLEEKLAEAEINLEVINQNIGRNEADEAQVKQKINELSKSSSVKQAELTKQEDLLRKTVKQLFEFAISDDLGISLDIIKNNLEKRIKVIGQAKIAYQGMTEQLTDIANKRTSMEDQIIQMKEKIQQGQGEIISLSKQLENTDIQNLAEDVKQLEEAISLKEKWLAEEQEMGISFSQEMKLLQAQQVILREQQTKNTKKLRLIQEKISSKLMEQVYFEDTKEVLIFAKQTAEYKQNCQLIAKYEEERLIIEDRLSQLERIPLEIALPELSKLQQQLAELKKTISEQQESCYRLYEQNNNNQKIVEEFSSIYQASQEQLDELVQLQQLSQTINGENPRKTSLERYVLQVYLQKVLEVANIRLQRLTKNRYQFELAEEVGSYRGKTGLEINIYDDEAGLTRGAHTLSGGESFIAALSLALALAEVIQAQTGGITIEALFIDEGFGSLDEEALEMAIEALETIENEGRMIGIISHVRELKERIVQQIRIETEGSGQSKVRYHLG
ncbi:MAG: SMC family ATPase [Enterococcus lacertideformus]|uniref:Nuclease SbcCD subunit C n=1 Tax=Enterococcus lacertideformus TaxID=2771493 RepID=A0A931AVF3_9ENTE|nr:SMC family ATPase [Enterococcus lacertideformus]